MKYPMIDNCLTFEYDEYEDLYIATHYADKDMRVVISPSVYDFLCCLDGKTHPYDILPSVDTYEIDILLDELRKKKLIRESWLHKSGFGTFELTLFIPKNRTNKMRPVRVICYFLNLIILLSFAPVLVFGMYRFTTAHFFNSDYLYLGLLVGSIIGIVLHEISHAISGCGYGARVFEMGALVFFWVMPGAYVMLDDSTVNKKLKKAQINAAGIEMNLLIAGIYFILYSLSYDLGGFFLGGAIANAFLGLVNMTLAFGLDGEHIIGNLINDDNFGGKAILTVIGREEKRILKKYGTYGYALFVASYVMGFMQISYLVLIATNIIGVILWLK